MQTPGVLRKRIIRLAMLTATILAIAFVLPAITAAWSDYLFSSSRIERVLEQELTILDKELETFSKTGLVSGKRGEDNFYNHGHAFYHFTNDSLVQWSTDAVPLTDSAFQSSGSRGLVFIGNGYYFWKEVSEGSDRWLAFFLVYQKFAYQNAYLPRTFNPVFQLPKDAIIHFHEDTSGVHSPDGYYLFSVKPAGKANSTIPAVISILLWFLAYVLLLALLYQAYVLLVNVPKRHLLIVAGFTVDAILLRVLILYFRFPESLHSLSLFQPEYFASSAFCPSLGDMALHALTVLWIAWVWYIHLPRIALRAPEKVVWRYVQNALIQVVVLFLFIVASMQIGSLVNDSSISFDLNDLFSLDEYSLVGFASIFIIFLSLYLISARLTRIAASNAAGPGSYFALPVLVGILALVGPVSFTLRISLLLYVLVVLVFWMHHRNQWLGSPAVSAVLFLLLFSTLLTVILESSLHHREQEKRKLIAMRITQHRDQVGEYIFGEVRDGMKADTTLRRLVKEAVEKGSDQEVKDYIDLNYIQNYWQRYELSVTVCASGRLLAVQPSGYIVDCGDYFGGLIRDLGKPTVTDSLYYIDLGGDNSSYLFVLDLHGIFRGNAPVRVYLEIYPRHIPRGLGYPELLIDEAWMPEDISEYSYAVYRDGELVRRVGKFFYSLRSESYTGLHVNGEFFSQDEYNHYLRVVDDQTVVLLSRPVKATLDAIAPFSYLLVFSALLLIFFYLVNEGRGKGIPGIMNLRSRLQFSMVAVILVSFIVVAAASLWFLVRINQNKNKDSLSEKAHSVLVEIEHKMADQEALEPGERQWMEQLLTKFSLVFFSDINMYRPSGKLLASSRSRIFEEGLISGQMNAEAWELLTKGQSLVILEERIGNYSYLSAYLPFRNNRNELLAYLNLPYFARQAEIRQEISEFMVAIINIYVILIALTLAAALFISNLFTSPLLLIREKIRRLRVGSANEKIEWHRKDEIGTLVEEYNRMVDALADSAETLARTERETAWREMARQVAHEIKNPLTPMKLSVQYLQRAWDDKAEDWDARLQRFTTTLTEQIDTLSDIATAFSDFARMPGNESEDTNLAQIALSAMDTFREGVNNRIIAIWDPAVDYTVFADRKQLLRVFNNLLKNALQAIGEKEQGEVAVEIRRQGNHFLVSVADNGPGIPEKQREKIFIPNFTTKSSGSGLGLAMTRNIVISHGGRIWYESEVGRGTIFHFTIPVTK